MKMKVQIKVFDMCFMRVRANKKFSDIDMEQCCESFRRSTASFWNGTAAAAMNGGSTPIGDGGGPRS